MNPTALKIKNPLFALATFAVISLFCYAVYGTLVERKCSSTESCAQYLREMYFSLQYDAEAFANGEEIVKEYPDSEVAAWFYLIAAKSGFLERALKDGMHQIAALKDGDKWEKFSYIGLIMYDNNSDKEVLEQSELLLQVQPSNEDFLWIRAEVLRLKGLQDEAVLLLDKHPDILENNSKLLLVKGSALYDLWRLHPKNQALKAAAEDAFNAAIKLDPDYISARYIPAWFYASNWEYERATVTLEPILAKTNSLKVHVLYWEALFKNPNLNRNAILEKFRSDVFLMLPKWKSNPGALYEAARRFGILGDHLERDKLEQMITDHYPTDMVSEQVFIDRINRIGSDDTPDAPAQQIVLLKDFINKNSHNPEFVSRAYSYLLGLYIQDTSVSKEDFLKVAKGVSMNSRIRLESSHLEPSLALSQRKIYPEIAEKFAREGYAKLDDFIASNSEHFENKNDQEQFKRSLSSQFKYAIALSLINQTKLDAAKAELLESIKFENSPAALISLAKIYLDEREYKLAEKYFMNALDTDTPLRDAEMEEVYLGMRRIINQASGDNKQKDEYLNDIAVKYEKNRAKKIYSMINNKPRKIDPIEFIDSEGIIHNTKQYLGRNTVVYLWASYCSFCKEDLPKLVTLNKIFGKDTQNSVINISLDSNRAPVDELLRQHQINLEYFSATKDINTELVSMIPLVLVFNKTGELVFRKVGANPVLVEDITLITDILNQPEKYKSL